MSLLDFRNVRMSYLLFESAMIVVSTPGDPYTGVEVKRGTTLLAELELGNIKTLGLLGQIFGGTLTTHVQTRARL